MTKQQTLDPLMLPSLYKQDYKAGYESGLYHKSLTFGFQAENERKAKKGMSDTDYPRVAAYWSGYSAATKETK